MSDQNENLRRQHAAEVENGQHDGQCEFGKTSTSGSTLLLCHCFKRARERAGLTRPLPVLPEGATNCPRCVYPLRHDGEGWECIGCRGSWDIEGGWSGFTDDFGTLNVAEQGGDGDA
jgi:hypothetical protein